jgi:hypothetical protein
MGVGVLDMPAEAAARLPGCLREAGMGVEVTTRTIPQRPGIVSTRVRCCRGPDVLHLGWVPSPDQPGICHVWYQVPFWYQVLWGWWPATRRRRRQFIEYVVTIVKQNGGYWPIHEQVAVIRQDAAFMIEQLQGLLETRATESPKATSWVPALLEFYRRLELLASATELSEEEVLRLAEESSRYIREHRLKGIAVPSRAQELARLARQQKEV